MPENRSTKRVHWARRVFRWFRIIVLLAACFMIAVLLWCNVVGVPAFLESAIRKEVRRRGIELEFRDLRLKGIQQLVASDVRYRSGDSNAPSFSAREAEFIVDYSRLRSGEFELTGIHLSEGQLKVPLELGGGRSVVITNIHTDVHFDRGDLLRVVNFTAEALGAKARVSGELKHLWKMKFSPPGGGKSTNHWQQHVLEIVELAEQLNFHKPPELNISIAADGNNLANTRATVSLKADEATSKWGTFDRLQVFSSIVPASSNSAVRGDFLSEIAGFRSRLGTVESLSIKGETWWTRNMERLVTNRVQLRSGSVGTRWFRMESAAAELRSAQENTNSPIRSTFELVTGQVESSGTRMETNAISAEMEHPLPFPTPAAWLAKVLASHEEAKDRRNEISGSWHLESTGVEAGEAKLQTISVRGGLTTRRDSAAPLLLRLESLWKLLATNIHAREIQVGEVQAEGSWSYPELHVGNLNAQLYGGYLKASGGLNVETRVASAKTESDFPYERLSTLLEEQVQRWFRRFEWDDPPYVQTEMRVQFPEWERTWKGSDLTKSVEIAGRFEGGGKFRGVPVDHAESHFGFTNFVWTLPDLTIRRPEGQARLNYVGNVANGDFTCEIESGIDPGILKALVPKEHQAAVSVVKFAQPPRIVGKASGNWDDDLKLSLQASVVATNFFVKEQAFSGIRGEVFIENNLIHCSNVVVHRGAEVVRAPYLRVDLPGEVMFVTNVVSQMDPYIAMSLIGEEAYTAINPYRFALVPTVRVNGIVPLRHWSKADLRFEVAGEEFSFWKFRMPYLAGDVHWKADHISFSNVTASFYGGKAEWSGYFVIDHRDDTANYSFSATTTNTELKYLLADLTGRTNHIEGKLDGEMIITSANSGNDRSWNGYGNANIEDGFLWGVPVFGIFSPVLDGIAPGLGTSRVTAAEGSFTLTNSVVYTRDLQVRAPAFRLGYKGKVDLDGNLEAVAEAQIFRDAWVVGKLFSIALWPVSKAFEAKVSGTVEAPETDLKYVPRFLLAPFRALNAIGDGTSAKNEAGEVVPQ